MLDARNDRWRLRRLTSLLPGSQVGRVLSRLAGVSVWNFCFDYVSRALCQLAAVRKRSGSASLWMVRTVCRYWPSGEPVV